MPLAAAGNRYHNDLSNLASAVPQWAQNRPKADFSGARSIGCLWDIKLQ